jgi:GNAT superfamily N-acetyltransferase
LAVHPRAQGQGVGRALVPDFETQMRERGGLTIQLGTDDEVGMTSLAQADLSTDLWAQIASLRNLKGHPYSFYQKNGLYHHWRDPRCQRARQTRYFDGQARGGLRWARDDRPQT